MNDATDGLIQDAMAKLDLLIQDALAKLDVLILFFGDVPLTEQLEGIRSDLIRAQERED